MPYPSSFETVSVIRPRAHANLDPARVSTLLERAFTAGGSTVTNSDGTYFEFRRPYGSARIPWLVRAGTIRTESRSDSIEVKGEALVRLYTRVGLWQKTVTAVQRQIDLTADPDDNRILECAVDGKADLIVSNDHHLLALKEWERIPIIAGPDFRRMILHPRRTTK